MADPQFEASFAEIDAHEVRQCQEEFERGGVIACRNFLLRKAEEWKSIPLNIGIIGDSGAGKSTLINSIRGLTADDEGSAAVGETETTAMPTPYPHPNNDQLKFWDLPGVGTPKFPKETYLEQIGFAKYDFFLIITKDRFTDNDQWIANAIFEYGKQFFFIRSKIQASINNDKEAHPRTHNPQEMLQKIKDEIRDNLKNLYREDGTFLIDSYRRHLYDFNRLEQRMIEDMPSLKRAAFILSVSAFSEDMIKKKVEVLRQDVWKIASLSAVVAAAPVPGLSVFADLGMILAQNQIYFKQLGLDAHSLEQKARVMSCDVDELNRIVEQSKSDFLTTKGITSMIQASTLVVASEAAENFTRFVPFVGSLVAGGISAFTMYRVLHQILDKLEATAIKVIQVSVRTSASGLGDE